MTRRMQMLDLGVERIGELAVCPMRRQDRARNAFKLRRTVVSLEDSRIVALNLSKISVIEGRLLGTLVFLEHGLSIQFKFFNPRKTVRDRLELVNSIRAFDIASLYQMTPLLANAESRFVLVA